MCGLAGIIDFAGRSIAQAALRGARDALGHRGPDDADIFLHEADGFSLGLAHTRLAVIDPTPSARQPMRDAEGRCVLVFNGEIYNFRELARDLPEARDSDSDTKVLLHMCRKRSTRALSRLDGMFALSWIDVRSRSGFLARDPLGIKPLYYAEHDQRLLFASELGALLRLGDVPATLDRQALALYLNLGFIPHPWTIYQGIRKLPPGHHLSFGAGRVNPPQRYWHLPVTSTDPPPFEDAAAALRERITAAVTRQTIADVPLGAFLSGGLDSSIVVACLAQASSHTPKTFSIGYPDHPAYDESAHALAVAKHFDTDHHHLPVTFDDVLATVEPMLGRLSEPFADSSLLPTAIVSRHARQHVTVALSGDGGDELFGGYWRYVGHHYLARYKRLPALLRKGMIEPLTGRFPEGKSNRLVDRVRQFRKLLRGDHATPLMRHIAWARQLAPEQAADLVGRDPAEEAELTLQASFEEASRSLTKEAPDSGDPLRAILLADLALSLPADMLHKVDTASMAHSLEVRVPLLATDVVASAMQLPVDYHIRGRETKRLLRRAFAGVLPESILTRRKMGFEVPVGEFLRRELAELYRDTVTDACLEEMQLDPEAARALYEAHVTRRHDHTPLLWSLLVLCHWHGRKREG